MAYEFTDDNAKQAIEKGTPVVIDFWAEWCVPCKHMAPIVEELAQKYEGRVLIGKYDIEEGNDLAVDYGVRGIPTMLFFKDGKLADRHTGSMTREALEQKIEALL